MREGERAVIGDGGGDFARRVVLLGFEIALGFGFASLRDGVVGAGAGVIERGGRGDVARALASRGRCEVDADVRAEGRGFDEVLAAFAVSPPASKDDGGASRPFAGLKLGLAAPARTFSTFFSDGLDTATLEDDLCRSVGGAATAAALELLPRVATLPSASLSLRGVEVLVELPPGTRDGVEGDVSRERDIPETGGGRLVDGDGCNALGLLTMGGGVVTGGLEREVARDLVPAASACAVEARLVVDALVGLGGGERSLGPVTSDAAAWLVLFRIVDPPPLFPMPPVKLSSNAAARDCIG